MIYLILLALTVVPLFLVEEQWFSFKSNRKIILILYSLAVALLVGVAIIRANDVGIDTPNYYRYFLGVRDELFEVGYHFITTLGQDYFGQFYLFKVFVTLVTLLSIAISMYWISSKKWLSLLLFQTLYLYGASLSLFRQFLAIGLVMIGMVFLQHYFKQKSKLSYLMSIVMILLGSLFHYSCATMLIIPILALVENRYKLVVSFIVLSFLLFVFKDTLISIVFNTLFKSRAYYASRAAIVGIVPVTQFILIFINQLLYRIKATESEFEANKSQYYFVTNLSIVWASILVLYSWFPPLARLNLYIYVIMCAMLPQFMKYRKRTYILIVIVLVMFYLFTLLRRDYQSIWAYHTIFGG